MPRRYPCAGACGKMMWHGTGALGPGISKCRTCRSLEPSDHRTSKHEKPNSCADCGAGCYGTRCRPCADTAGVSAPRRIRSADDHRVTRRLREQAAPGLTAHQRAALLRQWKRAAKRCTYCPSLATTVDHVLPLVRGGTNHEGNLAPCCRRCNSSKGGLTVAEWRTGRRLPTMKNPPPWATIVAKPKAKRVKWGSQLPLFPMRAARHRSKPRAWIQCGHCDVSFLGLDTRNRYCTAACAKRAERKRRRGTEAERARRREQKARARARAKAAAPRGTPQHAA